ncbi:unnamed protein product [Blumeria hordei]|uniref:Pantoate--beta-alanine ligase n=1 Tax=Blumeria hordei TaxID=2867405 RepID=A0A383UIG1_BLUHO|nr:unnamed protein product [Blumeria hordei]
MTDQISALDETSPVITDSCIRVFQDVSSLRQWRLQQLLNACPIALVPTMGALHEGHLSLANMAAKDNFAVVVSIYVNPTQFGVQDDLDSYPKTLLQDLELLRRLNDNLAVNIGKQGRIAAVFAPSTEEMYPSGFPSQECDAKGSFVTITPVGEILEGASRPTFFRGVATICTKLFNIVTPDRVYFGQKDIQQTLVIKKMIRDLCFDTQIIVGRTQREEDGLAMSSRNVYLGTRRRNAAIVLYQSLLLAEKKYLEGSRSRDQIIEPAISFIRDEQELRIRDGVKFELDYISLSDPDTMEEIDQVNLKKGAIISGAIKMMPLDSPRRDEDLGLCNGPSVRLLDNIILLPKD